MEQGSQYPVCKSTYVTIEEVDKHIVKTHSKMKVVSMQFNRAFNSAAMLNYHMQACYTTKRYHPFKQPLSASSATETADEVGGRAPGGLLGQQPVSSQAAAEAVFSDRLTIPI